jgi:ABC-type nitrate/sulfonate/bicarbonate transport system permease component
MAGQSHVTGRGSTAFDPSWRSHETAVLRFAIIAVGLVAWEATAASGLLYRDVVPSLGKIALALVDLLLTPPFYFHFTITLYEVATGVVLGGLAGLAVGLALGGSRLLGRCFEIYVYYVGPTPKIVFFPVLIMFFGIGTGSKVAMAAVSCFFPIALSVAGGMREIDRVLIRVGQSFQFSPWQMVTKIYVPAMRYPILNGVRLGLGLALIGTLLAETKLSNSGVGYLVIQAYTIFNMPQLYALLITVFVIAITLNTLLVRLAQVERGRR